MRIQVFTPKGEKVEIEVDPNDTISEVQAKVEAEAGLDRDTQRFTIHGDRNVFQEPMKIYVRDTNGSKFLVDNVQPLDSIGDIKKRIEYQEQIPAKDQYMLFGQTVLNDNSQTLFDYGIKHKSIIDLEPMTIFIKTPKGEIFELMVEPRDSVADVKKQILKAKGFPLDEIILTANGGDSPADNSTLTACGIGHRDTLIMNPLTILVKDGTNKGGGKVYTFEYEATDKIEDIKNTIVDVIGIPIHEQLLSFGGEMMIRNGNTLRDCGLKHQSMLDLEQMKIRIKTFNGDKFKLDVEPTDTLQSIKERIMEKKGIPLKDQILMFFEDRLNDINMTLLDCGIQHNDKLDIEEHMKINVQDDTNNGGGKTYLFYTEETYPISKIAAMIANEVGIAAGDQLLSYNESMINEDSMNTTLKDYGIKHKSTIHLVQMMINIETFQGDAFDLAVEPTDSLQSIQDRILKTKGIPLVDQILFFNNKRLNDMGKTLLDCGVYHLDGINVEEHMKVIVQDDTKDGGGKTYVLYTEETYPISKIAEMIVEDVGIPRDDQILSYKQSLIADKDMGTSLKDHGIEHKSTIHLVQMIVHVTTFQGEDFDLSVDLTDTLQSIKDRVLEMKGIPLKDQILWYDDERKDNTDLTLLDCGVQHLDLFVIEEHMKVLVKDETKNGGGKVYTFYTEETDPIDKIAQMVVDEVGIPKETQLMSYKNELIEDIHMGMPLDEYGIKHKSKISLLQMKIKVNTFQGDKFKMDVERTDTLQSIKERIQEKKDIPLKDQILFFDGERLDDTSLTLVDCGIVHNDKLVIEEHMKVTVQDDTKNGGGKSYLFYTEETYPISKIAQMIVDEVGIPRDDQIMSYEDSLIFDKDMDSTLKNYGIKHKATIHLVQMIVSVTTFQGDTFDLSVEQTDSLQSIKDRVLEMKGIPLKDQLVLFKDERLDHMDKTLLDCGIEHLDKLVIEEHMKVLVKDDTKNGGGKVYTFYTEETDSISKIAVMIADEVGIPKSDQLLSYEEALISDKDMGTTLQDYGIKHNSTIHAIQMNIKVNTFQGDKFKIAVEKTDKVQDIMDRIEEMKGIPLKDQIVLFNGERLNDASLTLVDWGIQHNDKLVIEEHMKVTVQDDTNDGGGKTYLFYTEETCPISKMAEMIADEVGIPMEIQLLSYEESLIDNKDMGTTLKDYGIKHKTTIHAIQMMITVKTFQGDKFDLAVEQTDTLQSIKDRILDMAGIPLVDQVLFFQDASLDDMDQTLVGCGVKHMDKLIIEEAMKVNVQDDTKKGEGKVYTFYTQESFPISKVMDMIADEVGIAKKKQLLSYEETLIYDKDMGTSLKDYGIKHQSTIHLVQMMITVKTFQGDTFMMTADPSDKCQRIKQKVKDMKDIPMNDQILVYNDRRCSDMDSMKICGIKHGDTVFINEAMKVNIQDDTRGANGKIYTFYMEETDTIHDVAMLIQAKIGIEKDKQRMSFEGENLVEEDKSLKDCGIKHDDTIHVKKSYIPVDWKKTVEEKYGKVKVTTYNVDYTLEKGVIAGIKDEKEVEIDITGRRKSEMVQQQMDFMAKSPSKYRKSMMTNKQFLEEMASPKKTPTKTRQSMMTPKELLEEMTSPEEMTSILEDMEDPKETTEEEVSEVAAIPKKTPKKSRKSKVNSKEMLEGMSTPKKTPKKTRKSRVNSKEMLEDVETHKKSPKPKKSRSKSPKKKKKAVSVDET